MDQMKRLFKLLTAIIIVVLVAVNSEEGVHSQSAATIVYLPLIFYNYAPPVSLRTRINNITDFLEHCPTNDPAYAQIRSDLIIRKNDTIVGDIACIEPISTIPTDQYTEELIILQALRTIYYMDTGTLNYLPWTSESFYAWIISNVDGINIYTSGPSWCCDYFEGQKYVRIFSNPLNRNTSRNWKNYNGGGIADSVDLIAHEVRHAAGGPGHDSGCGSPGQCDQTYDLSNLGSFGVQYWLHFSWMTGYLNVGVGCSPSDKAYEMVYMHQASANGYRNRISNNPPPLANLPLPPYGGPCFAP